MSIGVIGRSWPADVAVAVSAGSLALSLAGWGASAQAAPVAARAAMASPAAHRAAARGWRVVATPGGTRALADDLSASGKNNAWMSEMSCVKKCTGTADFRFRQLRWNGTAWRPVALPRAYAGGMVVPASPVSNWIVGAVPVKNPVRNVVLHWTGRGRGTAAPLDKNASIEAGAAPTAKGAWLFGATAVGGPDGGPYALHYASGTWRPVKVPLVVGRAASASSPSNVWVAGYRPSDGLEGVMAFNGKKWRTVPLPPLPSSLFYTGPEYIAAASPSNVWLEIQRSSGVARSAPCLLHWTGSKWTSIKIPSGLDDFGGAPVAQDGRGGVWLSLMDFKKNLARTKTFLMHYRNGAWTRVPVPATAGYKVMPGQVALTWIPGTRSLWGAAQEWKPKSPKSPAKLLILKYGP